ncbi:Gfo/Idh/MocA family oxidoreductase [Candidatus Uabimicrobium amorphum]|uniref:Gfo/Idh/MocA-like oxidoreductase N-terminal domain-containing protein n=1 Tax=Uabimicrobium amorphum TaxID=2596890 RepID=A0A5S9IJN8_UABAM|nr:Gfo/Idh/MocA family oxidoreductase [Candidatus Uabimicrobium amorphum]BBM81855.1 hypothetical protein UABAM_00196 [Candidatus Uabimicrobium amorphum]
MLKAVVCGARRARQGIGEYVCKYLHLAGVDICGVVSSSPQTKSITVEHLQNKYGIMCRGYIDLEQAIISEDPDIVVICTPFRTHGAMLKTVAKYNKHCLCDKPLLWDDVQDVEDILAGFSGKFVDTITQWPFTLENFFTLYPQVKEKPVETFSMLMCPISIGREMVLDAMPHVFSMLYSLVGKGDIKKTECLFSEKEKCLQLEFVYGHQYETKVKCTLIQLEEQPKPAKYTINNYEVSRHVEASNYQIYFWGNGRKIKVVDPLQSLIQNFIHNIRNSNLSDTTKLINNMQQLHCLYSIVQQEVPL